MLRFPLKQDIKRLAKGLIAMLVAIVIGVTVVDMQLNKLTQRHEFVQVLNVRRDPRDGYSAYFFGSSYPVGSVFPLARIVNTSKELMVDAGGIVLHIPTKLSWDTTQSVYWLKIWGRQFVEEAHRTKAVLTGYALQLYRQASDYVEHVHNLLQGESSK